MPPASRAAVVAGAMENENMMSPAPDAAGPCKCAAVACELSPDTWITKSRRSLRRENSAEPLAFAAFVTGSRALSTLRTAVYRSGPGSVNMLQPSDDMTSVAAAKMECFVMSEMVRSAERLREDGFITGPS